MSLESKTQAVTATPTAPDTEDAPAFTIVDCDVHETYNSITDLLPYLAEPWRSYVTNESRGAPIPPHHPYVVGHGAIRKDVIRDDGSKGSDDIDQIQWQHLDAHGISFAVLTGQVGLFFAAMPQRDFATALAGAYNEWLIEHMLGKDPRIKGSLTVAPQDPASAAREIDRLGDHPDIVQVILPVNAPEVPWGDEKYHPIWEAAVRQDLCVAFHLSGPAGLMGEPNSAGWPQSYLEFRSQHPLSFQAQLISMVCSGLFERFSDLRVVMVEGGFAWVPGTMWRLDQSWRAMRSELPWLRRRPSDYIRDHVRFTTQPFEEPDSPRQIGHLIEMMGSEELLLFSTDYPHWDFDSPDAAVPRALGPDLRRKIFGANALAFYDLS